MKTWLAKFRISCALDAPGSRLAGGRTGAGNDEVRRFEETVTALDRRLSRTRPAEARPGLHGSIMRAVRQAAVPPEARARGGRPAWRWVPASALAALALAGLWWGVNHASRGPASAPVNSQRLSGLPAQNVLEMGNEMTRAIPALMVGPLTDELDRIHRDLTNTARFLLANLP